MGRKDSPAGSTLRRLRQERGVSITRLANRAGYTKGYLSAVETGKGRVTPGVLQAYERALELAPGTLYGRLDSGLGLSEDALAPQWTRNSLGNRHQVMDSPASLDLPLRTRPVLEGTREIMLLATALVAAAAQKTPQWGEQILIMFRRSEDAMDLAHGLYPQWQMALRSALNQGWDIVELWELGGTIRQRIKLIEDMSLLFGLQGRYQPFYFPPEHSGATVPYGLLIVPGEGALMFFATREERHADAAFFFSDKEHTRVLGGYFATLRAHAQPLLKVYPSISRDYHFASMEAEERSGDRFLVKDGLTTQIAPYSVCAERVRRVAELHRGDQQLNLRLENWLENIAHRALLFNTHVRESHVRHIFTKQAFRNLLGQGIYSFDDWLNDFEAARLTGDESIACLIRVINLLKTHANYQIGLVDQPVRFPVFWEVVGSHTVFLRAWHAGDPGRVSGIDLAIYEPAVVSDFQEHFRQLWESLPDQNKDKPAVIEWLSEQIASAGNGIAGELLEQGTTDSEVLI